ncbi:hypothetical protein [Streptomyces sp. NBC_01546]|uniref:hypothetical protein n=1 Tax=Streptomyces sp. NBC_01546 TaxID=2975872 RepID=UPI00386B61B3
MHGPQGAYVSFSDVLQCVEDQGWTWRILEFSGTGEMPNGVTVEEFEQAANSTPEGVLLDWNGLVEFSRGVEQTHDLCLVAIEGSGGRNLAAIGEMDLSEYPLAIQAIDSTEWVVSARSRSVNLGCFAELRKRTLD